MRFLSYSPELTMFQSNSRNSKAPSPVKFAEQYGRWVQEAIADGRMQRETCWEESIAVGSKEFVEETKVTQGISAKGRRIDEKPDGLCVLRERSMRYKC